MNIIFVLNYWWTFWLIIDIAINLFTSEDRYFLWITVVPLTVYNPDCTREGAHAQNATLYIATGFLIFLIKSPWITVYPKKYAHGFCFAVLCCGYTLTDFPISVRLTSLALWQSNDCPSASKATLMNMDKYFMWIHYERLHNHNKAKHNKTVCIFLGIYCTTNMDPALCHHTMSVGHN